MLSIGTAGTGKVRPPDAASKGQWGWAFDLTEFMIDVQAAPAAAQARRLLGTRYLRVNHSPASGDRAFGKLDQATDAVRIALLHAGEVTATKAYAAHRPFIDRMLSEMRG